MAQSNIEKAFKKLKQEQKKTKKPLVEHHNCHSFTQKDLDFLSKVIISLHLDAAIEPVIINKILFIIFYSQYVWLQFH